MSRTARAVQLAAVLASALVLPDAAFAHGLAAKADLPIPAWLFAWAATLVLLLSFGALAVLWRRPVLAEADSRDLVPLGRWLDVLVGSFGVAVFAVTCWAGLTGTVVATANLAPTTVWVALWVAVPIASAMFGDVFRLLSPWRSIARAAGWVSGRVIPSGLPDTAEWPKRLGCVPAIAGLVLMAWLELASSWRDEPSSLAILALAYAAIQLVGMSIWGVDAWSSRGDSFGVAFSLISRIAPFERVDGVLRWRLPLSALSRLPLIPGLEGVALVLVGATTFDGFTQGPAWANWSAWLAARGRDLGLGPTVASEVAATVGLAAAIAVVCAIWFAGTAGAAGPLSIPRLDAARRFAGVLVPIALAYTIAHYASMLLIQGQDTSSPTRRARAPTGSGPLAGRSITD